MTSINTMLILLHRSAKISHLIGNRESFDFLLIMLRLKNITWPYILFFFPTVAQSLWITNQLNQKKKKNVICPVRLVAAFIFITINKEVFQLKYKQNKKSQKCSCNLPYKNKLVKPLVCFEMNVRLIILLLKSMCTCYAC